MYVVRQTRSSHGRLVFVCIGIVSVLGWLSVQDVRRNPPPAITVTTPQAMDTPLSIVQSKLVKRDRVEPNGPPPLLLRDGINTYRAIHAIAIWNHSRHIWVPISPNLTDNETVGAEGYGVDGITALSTVNGAWYVGTLVGGVAIKLPNQSWMRVTSGLPMRTVTAAAIRPDARDGRSAVVGFGGYSSATPDEPGHVYVTLNGGVSWEDVSGDLPDEPVQSVEYRKLNGQLVLSAKVSGLWYSMANKTDNWSQESR